VSAVEKYPGDDHRQVYWGWREYPRGMRLTLALGVFLGWLTAGAFYVWILP